jgi:hypothetical protein
VSVQVSTFIVLAKEQAEQEQLARSHHRQHYSSMQQHLGMNPCFNSGYVLPQQTYLNQQQQHANMAFSVLSAPQPWPSSSPWSSSRQHGPTLQRQVHTPWRSPP